MSQISRIVGERIRDYRKAQGMTLQQLADAIHKSRASMSKYEKGEIILDIETLDEISRVLHVPIGHLMDVRTDEENAQQGQEIAGRGPFFQANKLYFYFYDGRRDRLKSGVIHITRGDDLQNVCDASLSISVSLPGGRSSKIFYSGKVVYSDMLIRFSFVNRYNTLEEDLLYIFNPLELRDSTEGLLCGISSADLMPCAFKCLVTLTPQEPTEEFISRLMITKEELRRWQKLNMLIVDNRSE